MKRRQKFVRAQPFKRGKLVSRLRHLPLAVQRRPARFRGRTTRVREELKFFDKSFTDAVVDSAGDVVLPTAVDIPQGITESTRIGRKCTIRSIGFRFKLSIPELNGVTTPPPSEVIRVILYVDHQCNGSAAVVTGANGFLQSASFLSFRELTNKDRFTTLMDRSYMLNYTASVGIGSDGDYAGKGITDVFFKKVNIPIEYSAVAGALTEIRSNNIGLIAISQSADGGFIGTLRLRFSDG